MVHDEFSWYGVGPVHLILGTMASLKYENVLKTVIAPYTCENIPLI